MSNIESKAENSSTKADEIQTSVIENKKSLESLADQEVDGDNVLGGISVKIGYKDKGGGSNDESGGCSC